MRCGRLAASYTVHAEHHRSSNNIPSSSPGGGSYPVHPSAPPRPSSLTTHRPYTINYTPPARVPSTSTSHQSPCHIATYCLRPCPCPCPSVLALVEAPHITHITHLLPPTPSSPPPPSHPSALHQLATSSPSPVDSTQLAGAMLAPLFVGNASGGRATGLLDRLPAVLSLVEIPVLM